MERFVEGLHIEEAGDGAPIVLVHADFVDKGMWQPVMARLSSRWRVVCFDKRGYGSSDPASGPICRRRELESVLRALDLGAVHLVGCSNGGQSSLDLALERPELVRSLTLVNALPSGFVFEGAMPPELLEMMSALGRGDTAAASELQLRIWFDGPARTPSSLGGAKRQARSEAARMNRRFVERGTFGIADAVPLHPLTPPAVGRLGEIHVPTLVVSGALDHSENRRASKMLAEGIPGARLAIMDACAHVPPLEEPDAFATVLTAFLDGIRGDGQRPPLAAG